MARWKRTIKIKHLFTEDDSDENAVAVGKQVAEILEGESLYLFADAFGAVKTLDEFDSVLGDLYEYCDARDIRID